MVNEYNYLDYMLKKTKISDTRGVDAKGKRACVECVRDASKLSEMTKNSFFKYNLY